MKLRKLEQKDVPRILEWMLDPAVNQFFQFDFANATSETVEKFVEDAQDTSLNMHLAVVNDQDEYLGTISLKKISQEEKNAEYAISMRKDAQGTGASLWGTKEIIRIAFEELNLQEVYLNVLSTNERANAFYNKCGFIYDKETIGELIIKGKPQNLKWYHISKN